MHLRVYKVYLITYKMYLRVYEVYLIAYKVYLRVYEVYLKCMEMYLRVKIVCDRMYVYIISIYSQDAMRLVSNLI